MQVRNGMTCRGKETKLEGETGGGGKKVPKWKQQSAQLRAAMLAARPNQLGQAVASFPGAVIEDQVGISNH